MLAEVPPAVVTRTGPEVTPVEGTVTRMLVADSTVTGANDTPFRVAAVTPAKLVPVSVTCVAAPGRNNDGEYAVTVGTTAVVPTVKFAEVAVPPGVTTRMGPVVAPVGTDVTIDVFDNTVNGADTPLNVTAVAPDRFVPVSVTDTPRPPVAGAIDDTVGTGTNDADTSVAADTITVQGPVPTQPAPDQPVKAEPAAATAVSVTDEPCVTDIEHVDPQLIPTGLDDTEPEPAPVRDTVNGYDLRLNVAVTDAAAETVTTQGPVPVQPAPDQPPNSDDADGTAVNVTTEP